MEELQERTRTTRRRRKPRKFRIFFTFLFLVLLVFIVYGAIKFVAGFNAAKKDAETSVVVKNFVPDADHEDVTNYLLLGIDTRDGEISRTDTIMVLSKNKNTGEFKLVSFMRDIYADIPGYQNYKINTAYYLGEKESEGNGVNLLKDTLNEMFGIPIHHYAIVDFKSFESLIDIIAPEGIEIDVEKNMSKEIGVSLKKGLHHLNGKELLGYARFRKDAEGDFGRVRRQQQVINAVKEQVLTPKNIVNLPEFAGAVKGYVTTDLKTTDEMKLALSVIKSSSSELEKLTIPVEDSFYFNSYSHAGSVIEIDKEQNKKALHEFLGMEN